MINNGMLIIKVEKSRETTVKPSEVYSKILHENLNKVTALTNYIVDNRAIENKVKKVLELNNRNYMYLDAANIITEQIVYNCMAPEALIDLFEVLEIDPYTILNIPTDESIMYLALNIMQNKEKLLNSKFNVYIERAYQYYFVNYHFDVICECRI